MIYSIGGYDHPYEPFRKMVKSEDSRRKFILNVRDFLVSNKFDGLDVYWYTPRSDQKENFQALMDELKVNKKSE